MKTYSLRIIAVLRVSVLLGFMAALPAALPGAAAAGSPHFIPELSVWLESTRLELEQLERDFRLDTEPLRARLDELSQALQDPRNRTAERGFQLLWEQNLVEKTLAGLYQEHELKLLKIRYRKSIEIVKMLYEKVLSMDHHFSSLKTQQGLSNLSNPNNYPEFKENRDRIEEKLRKKHGFSLPEVLQSNPYMSAAYSIIGLVLGASGDERAGRKEELDNIACILDFTVRMYGDLNVIYYETGYLRDANLTLKKECESLFAECTRQVGYSIPLPNCRDGDDWERLYSLLDGYVGKALGETTPATASGSTPAGTPPGQPDPRLVQRATVNLQFSIDRVTQFIDKYSQFVGQGGEYYKKFSKIVHSYENEKVCSKVVPPQFSELKKDIELTLEKFNSAYRLPEVQGSKLKDMLYGMPHD
jgi:hypothetical protein